jgi:hypothetical protein
LCFGQPAFHSFHVTRDQDLNNITHIAFGTTVMVCFFKIESVTDGIIPGKISISLSNILSSRNGRVIEVQQSPANPVIANPENLFCI